MSSAALSMPDVEIYIDCADIASIRKAVAADGRIAGFTTNPALMRKAGVTDYREFALAAIATAGERPISFEVVSDDFDEMEREAFVIRSWGGNTFVKIPVTNSLGVSSAPLIRRLSAAGVPVNVTAILTVEQARDVAEALSPDTPAVVSVFAGRIADTGVDPIPVMREVVSMTARLPKAKVLWASPRELLNLFHAAEIGCHIITMTPDLLAKLALIGKDLTEYSRETVLMFLNDATSAGYRLA
ncbi:MAG TPA: transaldolase [Azospirillaceae bacterium]|nr:transaldolase [Azospirillaceae bacterium]